MIFIHPRNAAFAALRGLKLGDKVHSIALPIARAVGMDCVDKITKELKPESPCAKRQRLLNGETK